MGVCWKDVWAGNVGNLVEIFKILHWWEQRIKQRKPSEHTPVDKNEQEKKRKRTMETTNNYNNKSKMSLGWD